MTVGKALRQEWYIFSDIYLPGIYFRPNCREGEKIICWARQTFDSLHMTITTGKKEKKNIKNIISDCYSKNAYKMLLPFWKPFVIEWQFWESCKSVLDVASNAQLLATVLSEIMRFWSLKIIWHAFPRASQ